jgi:Lipocalin-like domain
MTALQNRLAGTFHLVSLETRRSDGVVSHPFGEQVVGSFMFDRAGNFAVQLMGKRAMAMFGTYVVDESQRTFTLTPRFSAHDPALIGTE